MPAASPESAVAAALDAFVDRYLAEFPHLEERYDPDWPSPCEIGEPLGDSYLAHDGERCIAWRPVRRAPAPDPAGGSDGADDFAGLEHALGLSIHPSVKAYYGRYWSGGLEAEAPDGHVSLLLLWNRDDLQRLVENLLGHALAKRRARSPFTVFFACTEADSELFLSVDNDSGQVLLEEPGRRKPLRVVAATLAGFLESLRPAPPRRNAL